MPKLAKLSVISAESGELAKPVSAMMSKVSTVVGAVQFPGPVKREPAPPIDNTLNAEMGKNQANDLQRRAWARFIQEQTIQQVNMEAIVARSVPLVTESADPEAVDEDWIALLFAKCRTVSNEAMRDLWAKVLAGEVNQPGTFSKRMLNLLGELDRRDIETFTTLCSFSIYSLASPVILYKNSQVGVSYNPGLYLKHGLDLGTLQDLAALGLIEFDLKAEYTKPPGPIRYFGHTVTINPQAQLKVGNASFTKAGWELARLMTPREIPEFFDYVKRMWKGVIVDEAAAAASTVAAAGPAPRLK